MRSEGKGSTSELDARLAESVGRVISANVGNDGNDGRSPSYAAHSGSQDDLQDSSFGVLEQRLERRHQRARRLRVTVAAAAVAVVCAGGYWGRGRLMDPLGERITYQVGGGLALEEGNLIASTVAGEPKDVRFSDGTRMRMEPRTRGRIVDLDRNGGKVALYQGKAHVDVRHRSNARWLFEAGPFEVRVHGTSFSISWNAAAARFDLQMESGVVSVAGPISGGEIVLHAGQTLSVSLGNHEASAGAAAAPVGGDRVAPEEAAGAEVAAPAGSDPVGGPRPDAALVADRTGAGAPKDWRAELAAGNASAVVADAERKGLARVLARADSEDIAALADAARYVGREDLARRALRTQRRRFPRSKRGAEAAFLLGRLEDESTGGAARALAWYDHYLAEAPSGAYVSEALGRKVMVLERTGRHDKAVAMAADYLRRFPTGSYAHAAGVLVGSSGPAAASESPRGP
jgi:TolA-binding protein